MDAGIYNEEYISLYYFLFSDKVLENTGFNQSLHGVEPPRVKIAIDEVPSSRSNGPATSHFISQFN